MNGIYATIVGDRISRASIIRDGRFLCSFYITLVLVDTVNF